MDNERHTIPTCRGLPPGAAWDNDANEAGVMLASVEADALLGERCPTCKRSYDGEGETGQDAKALRTECRTRLLGFLADVGKGDPRAIGERVILLLEMFAPTSQTQRELGQSIGRSAAYVNSLLPPFRQQTAKWIREQAPGTEVSQSQ
jgi:hypothetical protein